MKRQTDEEPESAPPAQRRSINSSEPEEQPRGVMIPEERPQEGPSTSGGQPVNPDKQPREFLIPEEVPQEGPSTSECQPVRFQDADYEQPEGPLNPEELPREDPPNRERLPPLYPLDQHEGPLEIPADEDDERRARTFYSKMEEQTKRYLERKRLREAGVIHVQNRRPRVEPRMEPPREGAPEEMLMHVGQIEPLSRDWKDSGIPDDLSGTHPKFFYMNQVRNLRRTDPFRIQLVKIHAQKIRPDYNSTAVYPRMVLLIRYDEDVKDVIKYEPYGEKQEHCIVRRIGNEETMVLRNRNYQDFLCDHLLAFLMVCGDVFMTIETIQYVVDSNPLIAQNRLSSRSNGPNDSFIEQFRNLLQRLVHKSLIINDVVIESRYRPFRESFSLAEFARCATVTARCKKFERRNLHEVQETVGVFGGRANVNCWIIHTDDTIDDAIRNGIHVEGFVTYAPFSNMICLHKIAPGNDQEEFQRGLMLMIQDQNERDRQNARPAPRLEG